MCSNRLPESLSGSSIVVLGSFFPSALNHKTVADELELWLRRHGVVSARIIGGKGRLPIAVRSPQEQPDYYDWHRDGCTAFISWSNGTATQLRIGSTFLQYFPFDVLLVNDMEVLHRAPPYEDGRWFARLLDPIMESSHA